MELGWFALGVVLIAAVVLLPVLLPRPVTVRPWEVRLLYRAGRFDRVLAPGRHWVARVAPADLPPVTTAERAGQFGPVELFSQEGFGFRATLGYRWAVTDPRAYYEATQGLGVHLPGLGLPGFDDALSAATLRAAAAHPLAALLADPQPIAAGAAAALAGRFPAVALIDVTVTRVTLPPEVRRLFTEVEAARLQGLAALERARGEQAALRSLANAARLFRDNPELAQLRLLQTIESARRPATIVFGQPAVAVASATD